MDEQPSGWAIGWSAFAGAMLILAGATHVVNGLVAIWGDEFFNENDMMFGVDLTVWGWLHLIGGALVVAAGVGIFTGNVLARAVGVGFALLSAMVNFVWAPIYPVWSVVAIVIDGFVIWALTVPRPEPVARD